MYTTQTEILGIFIKLMFCDHHLSSRHQKKSRKKKKTEISRGKKAKRNKRDVEQNAAHKNQDARI